MDYTQFTNIATLDLQTEGMVYIQFTYKTNKQSTPMDHLLEKKILKKERHREKRKGRKRERERERCCFSMIYSSLT